MKTSKHIIYSLLALVVIAALYRIIPSRPVNFAPQIAMAVFSGAFFINNKKWAWAMPLLSMFISDVIYEVLYMADLSVIKGFYEGQFLNYILFSSMTLFGFFVKKLNLVRIASAAISAPVAYFLLSNFFVWFSGGGLQRPKTLDGLMMCYSDALPFFPNSIYSTLLFSAVLFGGWMLIKSASTKAVPVKVNN